MLRTFFDATARAEQRTSQEQNSADNLEQVPYVHDSQGKTRQEQNSVDNLRYPQSYPQVTHECTLMTTKERKNLSLVVFASRYLGKIASPKTFSAQRVSVWSPLVAIYPTRQARRFQRTTRRDQGQSSFRNCCVIGTCGALGCNTRPLLV